jgi:hypothetical protein
MFQCLPASLAADPAFSAWRPRVQDDAQFNSITLTELDQLQGLMNRVVRRKLPAEGARAYFRQVDELADAYVAPWSMGESRLISNAHAGTTMQHRRAYQEVNRAGVANGSLVKRWPNEELAMPGQLIDDALIASFCAEEDGPCHRSQATALG